MPRDFIGSGVLAFAIQFEDAMLHPFGFRPGYTDKVNDGARPPPNQDLQWRDGDLILLLCQPNDMLVFFGQRLEISGQFGHGVSLFTDALKGTKGCGTLPPE